MAKKNWTEILLNILKIIGGIFLLIISFGIYGDFRRKNKLDVLDNDIKEYDNELDSIDSKLVEVDANNLKIRNDINSGYDSIGELKDKIEENKNKEVLGDGDASKSFINIRSFIND